MKTKFLRKTMLSAAVATVLGAALFGAAPAAKADDSIWPRFRDGYAFKAGDTLYQRVSHADKGTCPVDIYVDDNDTGCGLTPIIHRVVVTKNYRDPFAADGS